MNGLYTYKQELSISLVCASFFLMLVSFVAPSHGQTGSNNTSSYLYPPDSRPFGISYSNATVRFHTLMYSEAASTNLVTDTTGRYCALNQRGPVWYLAGTAGGPVTRTCTVPAGEALFFPLIANECSYTENPNLKSPSELTDCAKSANNNILFLKLSVDGVNMHDLAKFRVTTAPFNFMFVKDNIAGVSPGETTGVADGYFGYVKPLSPGSHTLEFGGSSLEVTPTGSSTYAVDATYHLTVK